MSETTVPTKQNKIEVKIKYRVYKEPDYNNGLLLRPKTGGYGGDVNKYDDFDCIEDVRREIERQDDWAQYVILPITNTVPVY